MFAVASSCTAYRPQEIFANVHPGASSSKHSLSAFWRIRSIYGDVDCVRDFGKSGPRGYLQIYEQHIEPCEATVVLECDRLTDIRAVEQ